MKTKLFPIVIALALAGCATTVSKQEVATARFEPLPANYQERIRQFNRGVLKDPYTAVYSFGAPRRGFWQDGMVYGGKKHFGFVVSVGINARNSFGGYTGEQMCYYGFENGQVAGLTGLWTQEPKMAGFIE
jgi:hypothetical protein